MQELQSKERKLFETVRFRHRMELTTEEELEKFDKKASLYRHYIRNCHADLRKVVIRDMDISHQIVFHHKLLLVKFYLCSIDDCLICKSINLQ